LVDPKRASGFPLRRQLSDQGSTTPASQSSAEDALVSHYVSQTSGTSIDELIRITLVRNKSLVAARESLRQAEARLKQARTRPNPVITTNGSTDAPFANEGEGSYELSFSLPIELGGKRAKRMKVAEASIELAKSQIADAERILIAQLRALFFDANSAASRLEMLDRQAELNQRTLQIMKVRLDSGDASRLDSSLLSISINQIEDQRLQARNELEGLVLQVKALSGMAPDETLTLRADSKPRELTLTREEALAQALANRPDLRAAEIREEIAGAGIDLARAQAVPDLSAFAGYSHETRVDELPANAGQAAGSAGRSVTRESILTIGVSVPLPLFNRQQGNIAESVSQLSQAQAERQWIGEMVRRDVLLAYQKYHSALDRVKLLSEGVIDQGRDSLRMVDLAYRLGDTRLLDLLNQERMLLDYQIGYAAARKDCDRAQVELERAIGYPTPKSATE
ncbi:MAG TPA: TolC family protein, partial [Blastocatellia bacterium]|nr:TolC family protein [Blastocatellia bacterium]